MHKTTIRVEDLKNKQSFTIIDASPELARELIRHYSVGSEDYLLPLLYRGAVTDFEILFGDTKDRDRFLAQRRANLDRK